MTEKKTVSVTILDQKFHFATDADESHVAKLAEFLDQTLRDIQSKSKNISPYHAAILGALNIAEKYFALQEKEVALKSQVKERSKRILGLLSDSVTRL
ncbi:MAG: cell division protein ZapA [Bacteriovoracia bacterium]